MPRTKLTNAAVERLALPENGQVEYWDTLVSGFGLRLSYAGSRAWIVMTRVHGKQIRITLGKYPALELAGARKAAKDAIIAAQKGDDPRESKRQKKRAYKNTVEHVAELFIERYAKPKNRSWKETKRIFEREIFPLWGNRPVNSITRRDVNDLLNSIVDRGSPTMSNRVLATVRKFFNWCMDEDIIDMTPVFGVKPKAKEHQRDRVLTDKEITKVWVACDDLGWPFGPLVRLLMLTAQRRDEVGSMQWDELDLKNKTWTIPRERTKTDRANEVPLSQPAIDILLSLPRRADLVFTVTGITSVSGFPKAKRRLDEISGVTDWRLHDLRRTSASGMARLGAAPHIVEKVLNHSSGTISGVAAVYNRYGYAEEKKSALNLWAKHIEDLLKNKKT